MLSLDFFVNRYNQLSIDIDRAEAEKASLSSFRKKKNKEYFIKCSKEQRATAKEWILKLGGGSKFILQ